MYVETTTKLINLYNLKIILKDYQPTVHIPREASKQGGP